MAKDKRYSVQRLFAGITISAWLAGCASTGENAPQVTAQPAPADEIAEAIMTPPEGSPQLPEITREEFLGQPPGNLEILLGAPALTRREGPGEFRRYDTATCRVYAVVFPGEGGRPVIRSLSVGALTAGYPAPEFASCFVTGS